MSESSATPTTSAPPVPVQNSAPSSSMPPPAQVPVQHQQQAQQQQAQQPRSSDGRYATMAKDLSGKSPIVSSQAIAAAAAVDLIRKTNPSLHQHLRNVAQQSVEPQASIPTGAPIPTQEKNETAATNGQETPVVVPEIAQKDAAPVVPMTSRELDFQRQMIMANTKMAEAQAMMKAAEEKATSAESRRKEVLDVITKAYGENDLGVIRRRAEAEQQQRLAETHKKGQLVLSHMDSWIEFSGSESAKRELQNVQAVIKQLVSHDPALTSNPDSLKTTATLINVLAAKAMSQESRSKSMADQTSQIAQLRQQLSERNQAFENEVIRSRKLQENLTLTQNGVRGVMTNPPPLPMSAQIPQITQQQQQPPISSLLARAAQGGGYNSSNALYTGAAQQQQDRYEGMPPPQAPIHNGAMDITPQTHTMPAFIKGLMAVGCGSKLVSSFASANAGEPYTETVIRTAASSTTGNGSYMKRSFEEMEAHNTKTRTQAKPFLHSQGIARDWHKMPIRGYGLGEELKRRIVDPRLSENYNQIVEALSMGASQLLHAVNGESGGTIPANSSLMRGVRFHTYDEMGRAI